MKNYSYLFKYIRYLLLIGNLLIISKTYGNDRKISNENPLKWEIHEKNYIKNQNQKLIWEIVPKEDNFIEKLKEKTNTIKGTKGPYDEETSINLLNRTDKLISLGGITVNNALIPKNGASQFGINFDSKGNYFASYGYSLSDIFQLELVNVGSIHNEKNNVHINKNFTDSYLDENNFNARIAGKFLLFSSQKKDALWTSIRTSFGRNESTNQGYMISELINTFRINNWLASNLSTKYFLGGSQKFGVIGASMYLNLSDKLQLIPEINYLFDKNLKYNSTISIRYSINEKKSIDLYTSNAIGSQDLGQVLRSKYNRVGIKFNLIY